MGVKECTTTPFLSVVFLFGVAFESIKELGGASNYLLLMNCLNGDDKRLFKLFFNFIETKR